MYAPYKTGSGSVCARCQWPSRASQSLSNGSYEPPAHSICMHRVRTVCKRSDYERARAKISSCLLDGSRRAAMRPMATRSELASVFRVSTNGTDRTDRIDRTDRTDGTNRTNRTDRTDTTYRTDRTRQNQQNRQNQQSQQNRQNRQNQLNQLTPQPTPLFDLLASGQPSFGGYLAALEACACVCGLETIALWVFIWVCV